MMIPQSITLPHSVTNGSDAVLAFGPEVVSIDSHELRSLTFGSDPMTFCLTILDLSDGRRVFVCTELSSNRGLSVTNAWPVLAELLLNRHGPADPAKLVFIEHYFCGSYKQDTRDETLDLVDVIWDGVTARSQTWRRVAFTSFNPAKMPDYLQELIKSIPQFPENQDSVVAQLRNLSVFAERLGLRAAAASIRASTDVPLHAGDGR